MTKADQIATRFAKVRPKFVDTFFASTYTLLRPAGTSDGRGGKKVGTPSTVETGRCSLDLVTSEGEERLSGDTIISRSRYVAELPIATTARETDLITIDGRTFDITAVKRDGPWGLAVRLEVEERKP